MDKSNRQLKAGAIISYLAIGVNIISGLLYTPWMIRTIGQDNYGIYTLASTLINMFLIDFGISSAVSRFVSMYNAENNQKKVDDFLGMIYKLFAVLSGLVFVALVVVYFFIDGIYIALSPEELEKFKVVYIIAATYSVISLPFATTLNGVLTSYEKFIPLKLCDLLYRIVSILLVTLALVMGYGLYALVTANAAAGLLMITVKLIVLRRRTPIKVNFRYFNMGHLREIFSFSIWVTVSSIAGRLIMNVTPSILGITASAAAIAIFGAATSLEGYTYTFSCAIDGMFMPRVSRIVHGDNNIRNVSPLMNKVGRIQFALIGLLLIGFIVVGKEFVLLWLGEQFSQVYACAILLMLPAPFYLSQQVAKTTVVVANKVKLQAIVNIVKAVVNVILAFVFSCLWGALGACISICISYFIRTIGMSIIYHKVLDLDIISFCKECYLKMCAPMLMILGIGLALNYVVPAHTWAMLGAKALLVTILYFGLMWLMTFNRFEKDLIAGMIKGVLPKALRR